ncbi:MAG TPA: hypothetical protein VNP98_07450 [Chthoniobacterales bacterium]|nr:hypothetical protein [Chthoniobacterales bacterium]
MPLGSSVAGICAHAVVGAVTRLSVPREIENTSSARISIPAALLAAIKSSLGTGQRLLHPLTTKRTMQAATALRTDEGNGVDFICRTNIYGFDQARLSKTPAGKRIIEIGCQKLKRDGPQTLISDRLLSHFCRCPLRSRRTAALQSERSCGHAETQSRNVEIPLQATRTSLRDTKTPLQAADTPLQATEMPLRDAETQLHDAETRLPDAETRLPDAEIAFA